MTTKTEQQFADKMVAEGWEVYHTGFPDFLCRKDGEVILVEVKRSSKEKLQDNQHLILNALNDSSPTAFVWSPDSLDLIPIHQKRQSKDSLQNEDEEKFGNSQCPISWADTVITVLYRTEGWSLERIADQFGITAEAVRQRILKAKGG
ncbi:hypothetical protein LCGC14_1062940 [marine sediment metagenome]|uniref:RNA polymerase sigma-70 region 4 domain-containing protein n=1 Tax=marine sediment metagenome TaxID=412755 RepID=A0A0F9Q3L6_9ZZZZ